MSHPPCPALAWLLQKLPVSVSELVRDAPAPTLDGSLMMGSQHTTVFLIDGASGQLIRTFYDFDGELAQLANPAALGACTQGGGVYWESSAWPIRRSRHGITAAGPAGICCQAIGGHSCPPCGRIAC